MHLTSHINKATELIKLYQGNVPLSIFLKQYFAVNKKHGSKDRKVISHLCYGYFRLGNCLQKLSIEERMKASIFLCNNEKDGYESLFDSYWLSNWHFELSMRITFIKSQIPEFAISDMFPLNHLVSSQINTDQFFASHFTQPDLFIRIRPDYFETVITKLQNVSLPYKRITDDCISLPNNSKIDSILLLNKEAVVQDYSSQQIAQYFKLIYSKTEFNSSNHKMMSIWDCCSASGGKSILAKDIFNKIHLTVSDIRESIIHNLKKRFYEAGIKNYTSFIIDLSKEVNLSRKYDLIICDAPCSGSGTWGRTPEQLLGVTINKLNYYANLQKKIVLQALKQLTPNGYFLYITCSVYQNENEEIINYIQSNTNLQLLKSEIICGYNHHADTMFAALFMNNNNE